MSVAPITDVLPAGAIDRGWVDWAIGRIHADAHRSADTHLLQLPTAPHLPVSLYVKDESTHPHREPRAPARALLVPLRVLQR